MKTQIILCLLAGLGFMPLVMAQLPAQTTGIIRIDRTEPLPLNQGTDLKLNTQKALIIIDGVKMRCNPYIHRYEAPDTLFVIGTQWARNDVLHAPGRDALYLASLSSATLQREVTVYMLGNNTPPLVFIDGVKIRGMTAIPQAAIAQVEMMASGIPADLGDSGSGFILIRTR